MKWSGCSTGDDEGEVRSRSIAPGRKEGGSPPPAQLATAVNSSLFGARPPFGDGHERKCHNTWMFPAVLEARVERRLWDHIRLYGGDGVICLRMILIVNLKNGRRVQVCLWLIDRRKSSEGGGARPFRHRSEQNYEARFPCVSCYRHRIPCSVFLAVSQRDIDLHSVLCFVRHRTPPGDGIESPCFVSVIVLSEPGLDLDSDGGTTRVCCPKEKEPSSPWHRAAPSCQFSASHRVDDSYD